MPGRRAGVGIEIDEQQVAALGAVEQLQGIADAHVQARIIGQPQVLHGQARDIRTQFDGLDVRGLSDVDSLVLACVSYYQLPDAATAARQGWDGNGAADVATAYASLAQAYAALVGLLPAEVSE